MRGGGRVVVSEAMPRLVLSESTMSLFVVAVVVVYLRVERKHPPSSAQRISFSP